MRGSMIMKLGMLAVTACLLAGSASAAVWIDEFDGGTESWSIDSDPRGGTPEAGLASVDVDSDSDAELRIQAASPGVQATDYIYMEDGDAGTVLSDATDTNGDLSTVDFGGGAEAVKFITFDFWANAGGAVDTPLALEFYMLDSNLTTYWRYTLHDEDLNNLSAGMNSITIGFWNLTGNGWYSTGGGGSTFAQTYDSVAEMGIILTYQGFAGEEYGIENFELHNPEPGTYAVLAFALMSLGVTFRGKLRTGLKGLLRK